MALTYTPAPEIGQACPQFQLPSVDGKTFALTHFAESRVLVVMFLCGHCPYVQAIEERILQLAHSYSAKEAAFVAICSNDPTEYPEDQPEALRKRWQSKGYRFPYLIDATQATARAFGAVCTPDFFVFDQSRKLAYRGRLDDSWRAPEKVHRQELKKAIDDLLQGHPPGPEQVPSMGCSIKWLA